MSFNEQSTHTYGWFGFNLNATLLDLQFLTNLYLELEYLNRLEFVQSENDFMPSRTIIFVGFLIKNILASKVVRTSLLYPPNDDNVFRAS